MKRTITVLLVACVLIFSSLTVASASMSDIIAPMADNYRSVYADLKITSGEATVSAKMNGKIGITTKVTIHLYLQQYKDGKWVDYDDWTKTEKGVNCTLSETVSVPKGYTYRAKASCYAYAGSKSEHVIKYSAEVKY